jgi:Uncharacterised conserved protein
MYPHSILNVNRVVIIDLLDHIGISQEDLDQRRRLNATDVDIQRRSKRFSFRRSVLPVTTTSTNSNPSTPTITINSRRTSDMIQHDETGDAMMTYSSTSTASLMTTSSDSSLLQGDRDEPLVLAGTNTDSNTASTTGRRISSQSTLATATCQEAHELAAAFRMMAATRSPDKEHGNALISTSTSLSAPNSSISSTSALFLRDDSQVHAMATAQAIEKRVVALIDSIGQLVLQAPPQDEGPGSSSQEQTTDTTTPVRSDAIFEYFCEKSMLSLFVDIAKESRQESDEGRRWGAETAYFHGVVWSPKVKAQIFATLAALISKCRNPSVTIYLLSNHYVNDLIDCMLPLQQWTDQALSIMMPPYVDMLQKVAVQLADDPLLFPFLTRQEVRGGGFGVTATHLASGDTNNHDGLNTDVPSEDGEDHGLLFPLYSAVLETATGAFAQSDSVVYGTCLVVAVNVMQIEHEPIQRWVCNAGAQQRILANHLCQRLIDRYFRIVNLTTGPVVDGLRSHAIANQLMGLKDHLAMIHEVFWSGVRGLDVRLCESLLQRVVAVLLKNLVPYRRRSFLTGVGLSDSDVIPEQEALAQVSSIFLAFLFSELAYVPFQRMLAVALFHEKSTPLFASQRWMQELDSLPMENYILMPLLSDLVTGDNDRETCANSFRSEIIKGLSGQYGEWRATACACLFQTALKSDSMDDGSLKLLQIVPATIDHGYEATPLEEAIATYLTRKHKPSPVALETLEYVGFLAIQTLEKTLTVHCQKKDNDSVDPVEMVLASSTVWKALLQARSYFAMEAQRCKEITGVSEIFLDMIESAVQSRYTARYDELGRVHYRCPLSQRGCATSAMGPEIMVRRTRSVGSNDVESLRFFLVATLHIRTLCKTIDRFCLSIPRQSQKLHLGQMPRLDLVEKADGLICTIGGLVNQPQLNADIDLTGRMTFPFLPAGSPKDILESPSNRLLRTLARERLLLVLDPTNMFVVRRQPSGVDENRATVLCSISLRRVIAAAEDGDWLHVAVRNEDNDDGGYFVKNGNMALQLETNGSCLLVKQYLDRSRESLRQALMDKVAIFLNQEAGTFAPLPCSKVAEVLLEEKKTVD